MRKSEQRVKHHVISMRISGDEWDSLREAMNHLQCRRVSDLMREAFKLVIAPPGPFETAVAEGAEEGQLA
jgi:hypothetical protein